MAVRRFFDAGQLANRRRTLAGVGLILLGLGSVALGGGAYLESWLTQQAWQTSPEAQRLARQQGAPTPVWITPEPEQAASATIAPIAPLLAPAPTATAGETARARPEDLELVSSAFTFLAPPEPGAHARVSVTLQNHAELPSDPILLGIASDWFDSYHIIGSVPAVADDRTDDDSGLRTFSFPPIEAGARATYELHVAPSGEDIPAPSLTVLDANGATIGTASPSTEAPPPRPGPVMSIDVPRLDLHSGVVQVAWEPPPFVVGQIEDSAHVTQGNTVLVGHLTGLAGNVFAHLDQLAPGDAISVTSRGVPYKFVVSRTFERPNTDSSPMDPSSDARLTLMTCAGVWNPFTHDYSRRLWVIAEPPDQAAQTIANDQATATAEAPTREAAATATALAQPTDTPTPEPPTATPIPTMSTGEPSQPGGLGNTWNDLADALGAPLGETPGKLVVYRQPGREIHVAFTPEPRRAALISETFLNGVRLKLADAQHEARRFLPLDATPRASGPEGSPQMVVERFSSPALAQALGSGDFSIIYPRDASGQITGIILGLGDQFDDLRQQAAG